METTRRTFGLKNAEEFARIGHRVTSDFNGGVRNDGDE